jgi:hypothetical protein
MNGEILQFLKNIGVNTRFVSLWDKYLFINNLRFSRFSRKKEEVFSSKFPDYEVVRSKVFQKMCIRASRVLNKVLNPKETIFILEGPLEKEICSNLTLNVILQPYTRKYGIKLVSGGDLNDVEAVVDSIASPLTLDLEVENIINHMFQGEKIELMSSNVKYGDMKIIYPLINIPNSWIEAWVQKYDLKCVMPDNNDLSDDLIFFFEKYIPNVRGNMLKSATFIHSERG